jgi:diguanylate cyclase
MRGVDRPPDRPADAEEVTERLASALTRTFVIDGHRLQLGASIGRALFPIDADDADGLLGSADAAMFVVKRDTRARTLNPARAR